MNLYLENKIRRLEEENSALRKKLEQFENKSSVSVCYGCGGEIDGPGHENCERNW